jgi:hypothetical protein
VTKIIKENLEKFVFPMVFVLFGIMKCVVFGGIRVFPKSFTSKKQEAWIFTLVVKHMAMQSP